MPVLNVDFTDVESFDSLPEGVYEGSIESIRHKEGREGKSAQLSVCVVVAGGEHAGRKAWQNLYFSEKAIWRMAKFFALFGIQSAALNIADDDPFDLLDPNLAGEPVLFSIRRDGMYKDQPSYKTEILEWQGAPVDAAPAAAAAPASRAAVTPGRATPAAAPARRALR